MTGFFGKLPRHGDFVRRNLPASFVEPWDAFCAGGIASAREALGEGFGAAWDAAPAWRFLLAPGACGREPVAGVWLASEDLVGRRFPLTVAAPLAEPEAPEPAWFAACEAAALAARAGEHDADALLATLPAAPAPLPGDQTLDGLSRWWRGETEPAASAALGPAEFRRLLGAP
jgi:type VI secretion system protein ImpM